MPRRGGGGVKAEASKAHFFYSRLRFRKNSLLAAKVIMVDMAGRMKISGRMDCCPFRWVCDVNVAAIHMKRSFGGLPQVGPSSGPRQTTIAQMCLTCLERAPT